MFSNPYKGVGIILTIIGAVLSPIFYFIVGSPPLAAAGISAVILGMTCVAIANARPYLSPEAAQMLLQTGIENTAALLEELGLNNKAIYMPAALGGGKPRALVPLSAVWAENSRAVTNKAKLAGRLIVRYGPGAEDMAIAVTTPGSVSYSMLEDKPGASAGEIEAALHYLLTGIFDVAKGVRVMLADGRATITVNDARIASDNTWYYRCLGSPIASIAATVIAEAINKPVRIRTETGEKGKIELDLEIF